MSPLPRGWNAPVPAGASRSIDGADRSAPEPEPHGEVVGPAAQIDSGSCEIAVQIAPGMVVADLAARRERFATVRRPASTTGPVAVPVATYDAGNTGKPGTPKSTKSPNSA